MKKIKSLIKTVKNIIYIFNVLRKYPVLAQMTSEIMEFINTTKEENRPMTKEIKLLNTVGKNAKLSDFVHLWACTGKGNPAERCRVLAAKSEGLKTYLRVCLDGKLTDENRKEIELFLEFN